MNTHLLKIEGMSCQHCVKSIESTFSQLGIQGSVDLAQALVKIVYDEQKVSLETIALAIEDKGYKVVQ
jgi:copper chaperone